MVSNRSFTIIFFALISAIVFLITAKRLDQATWDTGSYGRGPASNDAADTHPDSSSALESNKTAPATTATVTVTERYTEPAAPASTVFLPSEDISSKDGGSQEPLSPATDPVCEDFPDTSGILLVMKTGATESYDRLPVQIMTILKCLPDFLIFSDLEQYIGGHHVRDSLETFLPEAMEGNPDFDLYRLQKECAVDQDDCARNLEGADAAGWNLDKYKNIHMAEKSYRLRPDYDWYVFVDADTYVSWPNLVSSLRSIDASVGHLLGVPTVIGDKLFAHGGSGYVVSKGAMEEFVDRNPGIANSFDEEIHKTCCGDFMFAQALNEVTGVEVEHFWPLSNGDKPFTTQFGPHTWCHPVGMMHHMNSEEISSFWEFERRRYRTSPQAPLLFSEVYREFFGPRLQAVRDDWDNASEDWFYLDRDSAEHEWEAWRLARSPADEDKTEAERTAHASADECRAACLEHPECLQYRWHDECCAMHRSFRVGKPVKRAEDDGKRQMSGWDVDKIELWIAENSDCEERVWWPEVVKQGRQHLEGREDP